MKRKYTPVLIAMAIPLIAVAFALASIYFKKNSSAASASENFPLQAYIQNPTSLAANKYLLNARVDSQLAANSRARILSVRPSAGGRLALIVPESLKANIMAGQLYKFSVDVKSDGALVVTSMEKF